MNSTIPLFPKAELELLSDSEIDHLYFAIATDIVESDTSYTFHVGDKAFTLEIQKLLDGVRVCLFKNYNMHLTDFIGSQLFRLEKGDKLVKPEQLLLRAIYAIKRGYLGMTASNEIEK